LSIVQMMDDSDSYAMTGGVKRPKIDNQSKEMANGSTMEDSADLDESCSGIDRTSDFQNSQLILQCQGAEARLYRATYLGKSVMVKERFVKKYRHPILDDQLRREHLRSEIRCMNRCRLAGIDVPPLYFIDPFKNRIIFGYIEDSITVREYICRVQSDHQNLEERQRRLFPLADEMGRLIALLHTNNIIHGDLTTSNMLIRISDEQSGDQVPRLVLIDFGLSYIDQFAEDKGVDLYVLEKAFLSTHPNTEIIFERVLASYGEHYKSGGGGRKALNKLAEVRLRGRKREMIG